MENVLPWPRPGLSALTDPPCRVTTLFYDRQAQAEPSARAIDSLSLLHEELEYLPQHVGADTDAIILDAQHGFVRSRFGHH